jgi:DNA-binding CsgD family transcriptional regulator
VAGDSSETLSERELQILRLVVTGVTNREVAVRLAISPNTVKVHLRNIFGKLGVESRTEAALVAIRNGWVKVPGATWAEQSAASRREPLSWARRAFLISALVGAVLLAFWPQSTGRSLHRIDDLSDPAPGGDVAAGPDVIYRWSARSPMATARDRLACTSSDGLVFAIGGDTANGVVGDLEVYDPASDTWERRAPKPTAASNIAAAVLGDEIYVPGGYGGDQRVLSTVEVYSPANDTWRSVVPLPEPRCAYAVAVAGGRLCVFGGWDGDSYVSDVLIYDPERDAWEYGTPLSQARGFAAAAELGGLIYLVGGYDGANDLPTCEVYDPSLEDSGESPWRGLAPMAAGRGGLGLAPAGRRLYAVGGGWNGGLAFNESYDIASDRWQAFPTPVLGQWRTLGLVSVESSLGATLYAIGGWTGDRVAANQAFRALLNVYLPVLP